MTAPYPTAIGSIGDLLDSKVQWDMNELREALLDREDQIADGLRAAAMQMGAMPELTAEVILDIGIGRPVSVEQRAMVHQQFHAKIEEILRAQEGN